MAVVVAAVVTTAVAAVLVAFGGVVPAIAAAVAASTTAAAAFGRPDRCRDVCPVFVQENCASDRCGFVQKMSCKNTNKKRAR